MVGLMPTVAVARIVPKPTASTGLEATQLGLLASASGLQSGMLMTLMVPGCTPSPWLRTTSSESTVFRSAHTGLGAVVPPPAMEMAGMVMVGMLVSRALLGTFMTETVPEPSLRMKARRSSGVITP